MALLAGVSCLAAAGQLSGADPETDAQYLGAKGDMQLAIRACMVGGCIVMGEGEVVESVQLRLYAVVHAVGRGEAEHVERRFRPGPAPTTRSSQNGPAKRLVGSRLSDDGS